MQSRYISQSPLRPSPSSILDAFLFHFYSTDCGTLPNSELACSFSDTSTIWHLWSSGSLDSELMCPVGHGHPWPVAIFGTLLFKNGTIWFHSRCSCKRKEGQPSHKSIVSKALKTSTVSFLLSEQGAAPSMCAFLHPCTSTPHTGDDHRNRQYIYITLSSRNF